VQLARVVHRRIPAGGWRPALGEQDKPKGGLGPNADHESAMPLTVPRHPRRCDMPASVSARLIQSEAPTVASVQFETVQRVLFAIDRGDTLHGLVTLECSPEFRAIPAVESYLGYCIARERGDVREALLLCQSALNSEPNNPAHYLNLGRVLLLAQDKTRAIATFWKGISKAPGAERGVAAEPSKRGHAREHGLILDELRRLGIRKQAPFPRLHRSHPLNRITGKLLATLGVR
jgi:hypothetical protein